MPAPRPCAPRPLHTGSILVGVIILRPDFFMNRESLLASSPLRAAAARRRRARPCPGPAWRALRCAGWPCQTLRALAYYGPRLFYESRIASRFVPPAGRGGTAPAGAALPGASLVRFALRRLAVPNTANGKFALANYDPHHLHTSVFFINPPRPAGGGGGAAAGRRPASGDHAGPQVPSAAGN